MPRWWGSNGMHCHRCCQCLTLSLRADASSSAASGAGGSPPVPLLLLLLLWTCLTVGFSASALPWMTDRWAFMAGHASRQLPPRTLRQNPLSISSVTHVAAPYLSVISIAWCACHTANCHTATLILPGAVVPACSARSRLPRQRQALPTSRRAWRAAWGHAPDVLQGLRPRGAQAAS
jgi:hypothetical protein